jgi:hypothetical protein
MLLPPEALIDGAVRTLVDAVLPDVATRFARGQLYAVVDVLRNLRDRVEERAALLEAEAVSGVAALERTVAALRAAGAADAAARVASTLGGVPAASPLERAAAVREALVVALEATPPEARAALDAHLADQALRDVMVLKPSLLNEISKG